MDYSVELLGIHKDYGHRRILNDFTLQVKTGEMLALMGPSGAGKSTILNMVGLLDSPDVGEVRVMGGKAPRPRSRAANRMRRLHLGYLFQNFALIDNESVQYNLEIAFVDSTHRKSKGRSIAAALDHVGLPGSENRKVSSLSGGEQQRVAVARLLLKPCDIVLADEPTGSLDSENSDIVIGLLRGLNEAGKTVILATHDDDVARRCTNTVILARE
ncbi:ATP-binding cassette domain-containing protein [Actinoplanes sp. L3-i22]|uniref:ATP-binding cassette domain-containing protein n=1 Tax=Actinoplanes sp. L3-i22 TaxID=2836373 RepID=UPI001C7714B8|nr:ATP-binding cassette domain-containing protein [Actinoplanes sp. L3-i22]BCY09100.1 bacteriocin ABC transporter ATP-binding protein [Actinoplanes sp. L3-i22]